jgi:RNA polymerase sigma-70 factor (ECF subfamily)
MMKWPFTERNDKQFRKQVVELLPRMRRFALSLTGNLDAADDLVQATCERALDRQQQWQPGTRLDSWMFKMMHRMLIDEKRAMRNRAPHIAFEEERFTGMIKEDGMKKLEARLQLEQVAGAMRKLPDNDRVILSLVCVDGMSYKEAAQTLEIPPGTVMSRLARARKKLHELLPVPAREAAGGV